MRAPQSFRRSAGPVLLLAGLIFYQMLAAMAPAAGKALLAVGGALTVWTAFLQARVRVYLPQYARRDTMLLAAVLLANLAIGQYFWTSNQTSSVLVLPMVAAILTAITPPQYVRRVLLLSVLAALLLALYEKGSGSYLYVAALEREGELIEMDEKLMTGATSMLRAKAMFAGPLTLSAFCVFAAIILRGTPWAVALCFAVALTSTARTGIILTGGILVLSILARGRKLKIKRILLVAGLMLALAAALVVAEPAFRDRLMAVFDFSGREDTNVARIMYWMAGVGLLQSYDLPHLVLGNNGRYTQLMFNSAESGWLFLALNHGLMVLGAYLLMVLVIARRLRWPGRLMVALLVIGNSVVTLSFGLAGCLMFWMALFSLARDPRMLAHPRRRRRRLVFVPPSTQPYWMTT